MKQDWFKMWVEDKECIMATMARNMASDLENGYHYWGKSIQNQIAEMNAYKEMYRSAFASDLDRIAEMDENKVQHWCYIQLLKAGAITV